jgi:hypothetical protein
MTRDARPVERARGASGQATGEYVALVTLVAVALALAAGLTSGGVGSRVLAGMQRGLCRVAGTACPRPQAPRPDLAPCPLERTTGAESLDGVLELVRLGAGGALTAVRGSDGRVTVTLADEASAGGEVGAGLRLALGRRHGGTVSAGLSATVESGRSWTLPDEAAARAFVDRYASKATIGGKAVDLVRSGCSILCDAIGWRPHAELPPPDEVYVGAGAAARAGASLGLATLQASGGGLLGARLRRDGSSTWYLRVDSALLGGIERPARTLTLGRRRQAVVSYTLDARRRPLELIVQAVARGGADGGLRGPSAGARAGLGAGAALVTELDATLDLHDLRNRAAAEAFVGALRDPLALGELERRADALRERIARAGVADRRRYVLSSSALELGGTVGLGVQLGAGFARTREGMRLLSAETRLPGLPFLPRDDCRPG